MIIIKIPMLNKREVAVITSEKDFKRICEANNCDGPDLEYSYGGCGWLPTDVNDSGRLYYIFLKTEGREKSDWMRSLVHECVHLTHILFDFYGIKDGYENTETVAYFTDWMFSEALNIFEKKAGK